MFNKDTIRATYCILYSGHNAYIIFLSQSGCIKLGVPWVLYMPSAKGPRHTDIITEKCMYGRKESNQTNKQNSNQRFRTDGHTDEHFTIDKSIFQFIIIKVVD